jgi:hypothetical protein
VFAVAVSRLEERSGMADRKGEQHWLIVERIDNWEIDKANRFSIFGLPWRYKNISSKIVRGDQVYCYVSSGIGAFSDIRVVQESGIKNLKEDSFHDIYNRRFAYYFTTAPALVLPRENWVPLSRLVSSLEFTRERTPMSLRAVFQRSIRRLSTVDAALIANAMKLTAGQ